MPSLPPSRTALVRRARRINRELAALYPDAHCELDFTNPLELARRDHPERPVHRQARQHGDAGAVREVPRPPPTTRRPTGPRSSRSSSPPASSGPRPPASSASARRCATDTAGKYPGGWPTWSRSPAWAARPPTSSSATPSGCPESRWTRTSLACRSGLAGRTQDDPVKIEHEVGGLVPKSEWTMLSHRLIWHGRRVCHARKPACGACGVAALCPSFGTGPTDPAAAGKLVKTGPFS